MSVPFVNLASIHEPIKNEIRFAVNQLLDSNDFIKGNAVSLFEKNFANYIGVNYAVGCANGTDALELALEILNLEKEEEVIVPVHSWISTASAVLRTGAKVIFADTLYDEFTIDPKSIEEKITTKTRAIIIVHLYGNPCRMDEIMAIAQEHNLFVIEDCAQAHGATYKGKKVGSFGVMGCFSFYPSKNLGAMGDGGAVLTNNKEISERIKALAHCGQIAKNQIGYIGRNSRLDSIQAAILNIKLNYLDDWNNSRRELAKWYSDKLKKQDIILPVEEMESKHVYHLYVVKTNHREDFIKKLEKNKIGYGIHYPFLLNEIKGLNDGKYYQNACQYKDNILSLPMSPFMNNAELVELKKLSLNL